MPLGIKPTVDFVFKKIFGSPENDQALIGLLNAILDLPAPIIDVEILNPFSYQEFADDKLVVLDVRARDSSGKLLNIEMQVSIYGGLLERLVYYACSMYVDQLGTGDNYAALCPAISICLLNNQLFRDSPQPHHAFQMVDQESGRALGKAIEVHTVELTKYNLEESTIGAASPLEQWAFLLLHAEQYDSERLRQLLRGVDFAQAITVIETISAKTEDRAMYDQREKAQRDYQWALAGAREEGREEGVLAGQIQLLQRLLGIEADSIEQLSQYTPAKLSSMLEDLQTQLRSRGQHG